MIFVYDGSFTGFLTAVYESYYRKERDCRILPKANFQGSLIDTYLDISTDKVKANKVQSAIREKISNQSLENIYHAFLSELPEVDVWLCNYLKLGWKMGSRIDLHVSDETVTKITGTSKKVSFEAHRILGLLRFQELEQGIFYARFTPDFNILQLVAPHFEQRLSNENWVIHDSKRNMAALYNKEKLIYTQLENINTLKLSSIEMCLQDLWKGYFKHIAIESRKNLRLQKQLMPRRYWKHLIEKS